MAMLVYWSALAALALLLLYVIWSDIGARRIPNWLNLAVAALAVPYWAAQDLPFLEVVGTQIATALAVLLLNGVFWLRGWLGGGDLKLFGALALWLPVAPLADSRLLSFFIVMWIAGVALHLAMEAASRLRGKGGGVRAPYGVAISFAAFAVLGEPIVKQLSA